MLLSYSYDWWEHKVLLVIYLLTAGFLIYSWRYAWTILRRTPVSLYLSVAVLALLQYMGENAIVFPETLGMMVEELTEGIVYSIALIYLWNLKLANFEVQPTSELGFGIRANSK